MPRYHFYSEGAEIVIDPEGLDLADEEAARRHAVKLSCEHLDREVETLWPNSRWRMLVTDADGRALFSVNVSTLERDDRDFRAEGPSQLRLV